MFIAAILVYCGATIVVAGIFLWRLKREPQRWPFFLSMFAFWLAVPIVVLVAPPGWIPLSKRGHPSWLSVALLAVMITVVALQIREHPSRLRQYALIWAPILALLIVAQIVYPLVWQR
ncbi:MAG TPA: hypothetical protein VGG51_00425 [Candidatus Cybelea sp.]|jgi:hypothetical protein